MDISPQDIHTWYKNGNDRHRYKSLDQDVDPGRLILKTKFMNQHFINELDKIGLQLINITGTFEGKTHRIIGSKINVITSNGNS
jgi:hypothetical protein